MTHDDPGPAKLLRDWAHLLTQDDPPGPVLDLACGGGRNGLYLASLGLNVVLADRDGDALASAAERARELGVADRVRTWQVDLESGENPLPTEAYAGVLVFRYLHRPLLKPIARALLPGGVLVYETFTRDQARLGKPTNPDFLLKPGELAAAFAGFTVLHIYEGPLDDPLRYAAQLVARKPL